MLLLVVFSCFAILRIEGCLDSTLKQYSWNPPGEWALAASVASLVAEGGRHYYYVYYYHYHYHYCYVYY